jgi:hypothetical protein
VLLKDGRITINHARIENKSTCEAHHVQLPVQCKAHGAQQTSCVLQAIANNKKMHGRADFKEK